MSSERTISVSPASSSMKDAKTTNVIIISGTMQLSLARTVVWYSFTQQDSDMWLASGLELISDMITLRQALLHDGKSMKLLNRLGTHNLLHDTGGRGLYPIITVQPKDLDGCQ